jgi:transcriptional regulator with XRE-family HTH domain
MSTTGKGSPLSAAVVAEVRAELGRQNMSRAELSRRLGRSQTHVAAVLRGEATLTVDMMADIADVLGVSLVSLLAVGRAPVADLGESTRARLVEDLDIGHGMFQEPRNDPKRTKHQGA